MRAPLFAAVLLTSSFPSWAHPPGDSPRLYAGLGAAAFSKLWPNGTRLVGPTLIVGWQFTPRLALQLDATYTGRNVHSASTYAVNYNGQPSLLTERKESRGKYLVVPVLLRYRVLPPARRWHLDALAGASVLYSSAQDTYTTTISGQVPDSQYSFGGTAMGASLVAGPALQYGLSPHLGLTAEVLLHCDISHSYDRFSQRFFSNPRVGLRYYFS